MLLCRSLLKILFLQEKTKQNKDRETFLLVFLLDSSGVYST